MSPESSPEASGFRRAVTRTREILDGLEGGHIRATELPQLLEARFELFPRLDDPAALSDVDQELLAQLQELDRQLMNWCQRAIGETREHLGRARRKSRPSSSPTPRLVSESA